MIDYKVIDLNTYARRAHLEYFMSMERPQVNVTAEVDVTELRKFCKEKGCSFFLAFLHVVALSADSIPQFRQRIHRLPAYKANSAGALYGFEIREYSESPTSHTESTGDELYCYCTLGHHRSWDEYIGDATKRQQMAREKGSLEEDAEIEAFYFATCIPWIYYTDIVHPTTDRYDSNPRFSWGKFKEDYRGRLMMPLTVVAHHGLVDGIHIGKFYSNVEKNIDLLIKGQL